MKEYERFDRIGTTPHRSYYIPFAQEDVVRTKHSILDRTQALLSQCIQYIKN